MRDKLPSIGINRLKLVSIVASAIPVTIVAWTVSTFLGDPEAAITAQDVVIVVNALGVPLGFLLGRASSKEDEE